MAPAEPSHPLVLLLIALGLLLLPAQQALGQNPSVAEAYPLASTEAVRIMAPRLEREYTYMVTLPLGYAANPDRRYPVLYYTDAPQSIALIAGMYRRMRDAGMGLQDAILVGLGYAMGDSGETSRRRDYTPTPNGDIDARSNMPGQPVVYGEAEPYRQHLAQEAFPELERRYRIDPSQRIYLGHSYGGLFGVHVLLTEPRMFRQYVLISPSLWYDRRLMLARERGYATRHKDLPARALFLVGGAETVPDPDHEPHSRARFQMVEDMGELVRQLQARHYPGLSIEQRVLPGENHASVYVPAVQAGLSWALPGTGRPPHVPCAVPDCRVPFQPQKR